MLNSKLEQIHHLIITEIDPLFLEYRQIINQDHKSKKDIEELTEETISAEHMANIMLVGSKLMHYSEILRWYYSELITYIKTYNPNINIDQHIAEILKIKDARQDHCFCTKCTEDPLPEHLEMAKLWYEESKKGSLK